MKASAIINEYIREYVFDVDFDKLSSSTISTNAVFVKGENETSVLKARLLKNKKPINLSGYVVSMNIIDSLGNLDTLICTNIDEESGTVTIDLPPYLIEGVQSQFEIVIQTGSKVLMSSKYSYMVLSSIGEGYIGTSEEHTALHILISQVEAQKVTINEIVEELEVTENDIDEILGMIGGL